MKRFFSALVFLFTALAVFPQRQAVVAILPFEAGTGLSDADAASVTAQLVNELQSWGTINIVGEDQARSAEYLVRGRVERQNNQVVLSAVTHEGRTDRVLNSAKEQAPAMADLAARMASFASQVTENVPFPNYFPGRWQAELKVDDGSLICILEFRSDRTIRVLQYDTWERRGTTALRYQGIGTGTYSYWGHARRTVRGMPVDGFITLRLGLEDVLPKYAVAEYTRINFNFNEDKTVFELAGGFGCGESFPNPQAERGDTLAYTRFTKIQ